MVGKTTIPIKINGLSLTIFDFFVAGAQLLRNSSATLVHKGPHNNRPQGPLDQGNISQRPPKQNKKVVWG